MLFLVLLVLPALINAGHVDRRPPTLLDVNIQRRHYNDQHRPPPNRRSFLESTLRGNPNDVYITAQPHTSQHDEPQDASSLVSDLLVARLAEDCKYCTFEAPTVVC